VKPGPLSRQAKLGYVRDLDRLREFVHEYPMLVTFDFEKRQFCVSDVGEPEHVIARGRFQVVSAWLSGYKLGYAHGRRHGTRPEWSKP